MTIAKKAGGWTPPRRDLPSFADLQKNWDSPKLKKTEPKMVPPLKVKPIRLTKIESQKLRDI